MAEGGQEDDGLEQALQLLSLEEQEEDSDDDNESVASAYSANISVWPAKAKGDLEEKGQIIDVLVPTPEEPVTVATLIPIIETLLERGNQIVQTNLRQCFMRTLGGIRNSKMNEQLKQTLNRKMTHIDNEQQRLMGTYNEILENINRGETDYKIVRYDNTKAREFLKSVESLVWDTRLVECTLSALDWYYEAKIYFEAEGVPTRTFFIPESYLFIHGRNYGTLFNEMQRKIEIFTNLMMQIRAEVKRISERWEMYLKGSARERYKSNLLEITVPLDNMEEEMKEHKSLQLEIPTHEQLNRVKRAICAILCRIAEIYMTRLRVCKIDRRAEQRIAHKMPQLQKQEAKGQRLRQNEKEIRNWELVMRRRAGVNYLANQRLGIVNVPKGSTLRHIDDPPEEKPEEQESDEQQPNE